MRDNPHILASVPTYVPSSQLSIFNELKFAINALPETFINMLQVSCVHPTFISNLLTDVLQEFVFLRRIERYLAGPEVSPIPPLNSEEASQLRIALRSATIAWPHGRDSGRSRSVGPLASATPSLTEKFILRDLNVTIPMGEMTLVCGKLGSGKSLLLLALLGETDLLAGQIICPRTPPESLAAFAELGYINPRDWVVPGVLAYVPQSAWLQNASIRENILFSLPYDERRYEATLEVSSRSESSVIRDLISHPCRLVRLWRTWR